MVTVNLLLKCRTRYLGVAVSCAALLVSLPACSGEYATIELASSKNTYLLGEPITVSVTVTQHTRSAVNAPEPDFRFPANGFLLFARQNAEEPVLLPEHFNIPRRDGRLDGMQENLKPGIFAAYPGEGARFIRYEPEQPVCVVNVLQVTYAGSLKRIGVGDFGLFVQWDLVPDKPRSNEIRITVVSPVTLVDVKHDVDFGLKGEGARQCRFSVITYPRNPDDKSGVDELYLKGEVLLLREGKEVDSGTVLFLPLGSADRSESPQLMLDKDSALHVLVRRSPGWYVHTIFPRTSLDLTRQLQVFGDTSRAAPITQQYVTAYKAELVRNTDGTVVVEKRVETTQAGPSRGEDRRDDKAQE